jgi:hypothetical protein
MNTVNDELVIGDADLKRAQLVKMSLEALAIAMTCVIYAQMILDDDVKARIASRIKKWKVALFGRPPLTEAEIQEAVHQVNIEATRTVREAWDNES